ncbi:hypothetical protein ACFE04_015249 [Oxalis oulophora]
MFSGQPKNPFGVFKWKWRGESSLRTSLLNIDVPPEIELSSYGRIPSPGSESPSGLLNGESLSVEAISDLDLFFERLYSYYCEKGLWCIIIKWIVELLSLGFTICFSGFFLLFVDWNGLRNAKCGMDAVESGIKPCDLSKEAFHQHPLTPLTLTKAIIVGYLGLFSVYWIFCFLSLHVTDSEVQTMPWATILDKVVRLQSSEQLCVVKDLSAHDIVMRLMRKENYLIGMLNKGVLAFPIARWVPGAGPAVKLGSDGTQYRPVLTKTLEWTLNWCILQSMFDRNFCVRRDFISNPKTLKKRLMVVGLAMLLLSPFLVIFMLVYLFLRHAEQFYNHPTTASSRRWSNLSRWIFREFNEVDHLFKHRINSSVVHASNYLKQFPSPIISIIAKFISFLSGGFAAVLISIAFLEESLLEGHIFGRNLLWYTAVFGTITAISRAAIADELLVLDAEGAMSMVVQHSHYMPKKWRGKENTETVRTEFETLFQYTGMMLLEEMASIFLTPFLLIFVLPKRVDDILQFIADFSVHVEGIGHVCRFSAFDFENHGNSNYGSPHHVPRIQRSSQGKMEKSFLSFQSSYPSWEPNSQGKQFLSNLRTFREQKLQGHVTRPAYSPPRMWRGSPNLRFNGDEHDFLNSPEVGQHLGSLWLIEADQKNHPYLVDWYYTEKIHHPTSYTRDRDPTELFKPTEQQADDYWTPNLPHNQMRHDESWGNYHDEHRSHSHLEASTSAPHFRESVFQQHDIPGSSAGPTRSNWWARNNPCNIGQQQASFLEPPSFNHHYTTSGINDHCENISERSLEQEQGFDWRTSSRLSHNNTSERSLEQEREQEEGFDWRTSSRLSRTVFQEDGLEMGGDDIKLYFDDVYSKPPETPSMKLDIWNE